MAWSTREIAELAGTSLRAVRHYHEVGLLDEPERRPNGYKQYGVAHLTRLLRIKRLVGLGFSLPQIRAMGEDDDHPEQALRSLDAEIAATIERLQGVRDELDLLLRHSAYTDLPPEFAPAIRAKLPESERSLVVVMSRILSPRGRRALVDMLIDNDVAADPAGDEFDRLSADADEPTRIALAERLSPLMHQATERHPEVNDLSDAPGGEGFAQRVIGKALLELYNTAQLDVLKRANELRHPPEPDQPV